MKRNLDIFNFKSLIIVFTMLFFTQQAHAFWWTLFKYGSVGTGAYVAGTAVANAKNKSNQSSCKDLSSMLGVIFEIRLKGVSEEVVVYKLTEELDSSKSKKLITNLIHKTYVVPLSQLNISIDSTDEEKEVAVRNFKSVIADVCYQEMNKDDSVSEKNNYSEIGNYYVTAKALNVRLSPNKYGKITDKLYKRQKINVLEIKDKWARISFYFDGSSEGISGSVARWVSVDYLSANRPIK